jgi:hypothetical protein
VTEPIIEADEEDVMTITPTMVNEVGDEITLDGNPFPVVMPKPFITGETLKWTYPTAGVRFIRHKERRVKNKVKGMDGKVIRDANGKAVLVEMCVPAFTQIVKAR